MPNNVIDFPVIDSNDFVEFENLICNCGCEFFLVSIDYRVVCVDCRCWMEQTLLLDGNGY